MIEKHVVCNLSTCYLSNTCLRICGRKDKLSFCGIDIYCALDAQLSNELTNVT